MSHGILWIIFLKDLPLVRGGGCGCGLDGPRRKISILLNGLVMGRVTSSRGLRQGDYLSPMFCVLLGESLDKACVGSSRSWNIGRFHSCWGRGINSYSPMVDDTLLMLEEKEEAVTNLKNTMIWLELISGLQVNFTKSWYYLVNEVQSNERLVNLWGCRVGKFLDIYLRMSLGAIFKDKGA